MIQHRRGVPWYKAPKPSQEHHCEVQSSGEIKLTLVERCACGAVRLDGGPWFDRNQR